MSRFKILLLLLILLVRTYLSLSLKYLEFRGSMPLYLPLRIIMVLWPGSMKNFLDYFWWSLWANSGYICSSHEKGFTVMDQISTSVRQRYGRSMPYGISINGEKDLGSSGNLTNNMLLQRMQMLARDIVVSGKLHRNQFLDDIHSNEIHTFAYH